VPYRLGEAVARSAEVFAHHSAIEAEGYRSLRENQRVEYTAARSPRGLQAEQVQPQ
jgi:cold shock protein